MPFDPRLNCAADICCSGKPASDARVSVLCDLGLDEETATALADKMHEAGLWLAPVELATVIRKLTYESDNQTGTVTT